MAYSVHNITQITDVPALVGAFAAANGFDTDLSSPNTPRIRCPGDSNSVEDNLWFQIQATISGTNNQNHDCWWSEGYGGSNSLADDDIARITSPKLNGSGATTANPTVSLPTRLHIFGTAVATDSPFIACVIEYGFNSYRHLFFGKMEARGNYTGREVIACAGGRRGSTSASPEHWTDDGCAHFMFSGFSQVQGVGGYGGVRVIHVDNPTEWRRFDSPIITSTPFDEYTNEMVVGGFQDGFNDGWVMDGKAAFAGLNLLVPINLYAPIPISAGTDTSFYPLGRPPGVRMVNMQDLEPGQQITVGNETWRVFPHTTKSAETQQINGVGGVNWPSYETSYYLGYAYLEEDAP